VHFFSQVFKFFFFYLLCFFFLTLTNTSNKQGHNRQVSPFVVVLALIFVTKLKESSTKDQKAKKKHLFEFLSFFIFFPLQLVFLTQSREKCPLCGFFLKQCPKRKSKKERHFPLPANLTLCWAMFTILASKIASFIILLKFYTKDINFFRMLINKNSEKNKIFFFKSGKKSDNIILDFRAKNHDFWKSCVCFPLQSRNCFLWILLFVVWKKKHIFFLLFIYVQYKFQNFFRVLHLYR